MSIFPATSTYSASEARERLYKLIKATAKGTRVYEIQLRGENPVMLVSKAELESWQETLDILTSPSEIKTIRKARKQKKTVPHAALLKKLGLENAA